MKKFFKWLGIILGGLLALIVILFFGMAIKGSADIARTYNVTAENVVIPGDAASIARGGHWVKAICAGCHKADLSGDTAFFDGPFAHIESKNLTSGLGGAGTEFADADWIRAIRHGVNPENHSLIIMPSYTFWYFSDQDLGDIIAYVKSVPAVDNETADPQVNLLGRAMFGAGIFGKGALSAQVIQHTIRPDYPAVGVTAAYGTYLVNVSGCHDCHGPNLAGGKSPDPSAKNAPNLTPGGKLANWQAEDFITTIHTGVPPDGKPLDPKQMPWKDFTNYSDDELNAIFLYLQSLPKMETVVP
jgi:mono/diheme cytochrome c family protein